MRVPPRKILKYYVLRLFGGLFFTYVIQTIFLLSRGITIAQLALYASLTVLSSTLLEIPTGFIADRFGRKVSVSLAYFVNGLAYFALIFVHDFTALAVVAIIRGLGSALQSGALDALVYDELQDLAQGSSFLKLKSQGSTLGITAGAFASFVSPIMYVANPLAPFILTGVMCIASSFFVLSFEETRHPAELVRRLKLIDGIRSVLKLRPVLLIMLMDMLLLIFVNIYYSVLFFPKINGLGMAVEYLGIVDVVTLAFTSILLFLVARFAFRTDKLTLLVYTLGPAVAFVLFGMSASLVPALIFGMLFDPLWNIRLHVVPSLTNKYFEAHNRALSLSSVSFVSNLGAAILLPLAVLLFNSSYLFALIPLALILLLLALYPGRSSPAATAS